MIKDLKAREILDSRGNPTVEVSLFTDDGVFTSSVPSGASTGSFEAKELRDGGERYGGRGVLTAVENINQKIAPLITGKKVEPVTIDKLMVEADGSSDKSEFGANAILGVSMSIFRAAAKKEKVPLYDYLSFPFNRKKNIPYPCFNLINGGVHGGGGVDFQEFMILPQKERFADNLRFAVEFSCRLKEIIAKEYGVQSINIGDEGGFVPDIKSEKEVLEVLGKVDRNTSIVIDVAATELYHDNSYFVGGLRKSTQEMIALYRELIDNYPVLGIEDPLEESDFSGWGVLRQQLNEVMIIGDDLLTTNTKRMEVAKENNSCNAMILKINQIGSVTEAVAAAKKAKDYNWKIIVSHRSGETNDDFIADFAVGVGADYIKSGAPVRGERVAKYNRLLQIEEEILKT